jgi:hypothetical protein
MLCHCHPHCYAPHQARDTVGRGRRAAPSGDMLCRCHPHCYAPIKARDTVGRGRRAAPTHLQSWDRTPGAWSVSLYIMIQGTRRPAGTPAHGTPTHGTPAHGTLPLPRRTFHTTASPSRHILALAPQQCKGAIARHPRACLARPPIVPPSNYPQRNREGRYFPRRCRAIAASPPTIPAPPSSIR